MEILMKFAAVLAVGALCLLVSAPESQGAPKNASPKNSITKKSNPICARGSFTTDKCEQALQSQLSQAKKIVACLTTMDAEYSGAGKGKGEGAGKQFVREKAECLALIISLRNDVTVDDALSADEPDDGGDGATPTSADDGSVQNAIDAIREWTSR
jgi:hypothetical protein